MKFLKEVKKYKKSILKNKEESLKSLVERAGSLEKKQGFFINSLKKRGMSLIAEVKIKSPSKGKISLHTVEKLAGVYEDFNADCVSVLTEDKYFSGRLDNIRKVRAIYNGPVLMKDFIISEYQIYEGAIAGADAVLLIVSILSKRKLKKFLKVCKSLNMSALVEVHSKEELKRCLNFELEIVGVNSRNLNTLKVDNKVFREIADIIPSGIVKVAMSGINSKEDIRELYKLGYDAVLVGEAIVGIEDPGTKIQEFKSI